MSKQLAVVGSPIEHSKSPQIHTAAYSALGLDWNYGKTELKQGRLLQFVESLDENWLGLSVTMPLKYEAARIAHEKHDDVIATSVANTLVRVDERWRAFNTDVYGIQQALKQELDGSLTSVLVIGSGATATSTVYALARSAPTVRVTIVARNAKAAKELKLKFPELSTRVRNWRTLVKCLSTHDLVISTVPAISWRNEVHRLKKNWLRK
jgi:shikimate dehydrogenase